MTTGAKGRSAPMIVAAAALAIAGTGLAVGGAAYAGSAPGAFQASLSQSEQLAAEREALEADRAELDADRAALEKAAEEGAVTTAPEAPPAERPERALDPERYEPGPDGDLVHHVSPGETLTSISFETGISVDRLAEYNSITDVDVIYADSALRVPVIMVPVE